MGTYWGLDIGGTKCALVTGTEDCRVLTRHAVATRDFERWQDVLEALLAQAPAETPTRPSALIPCSNNTSNTPAA